MRYSHGAAQGKRICVTTPIRFMNPNALAQYCIDPFGPNIHSSKATTNGRAKCRTPYGSQARTSRTGLVYLVCRSEILAPYNTDSSAGRRLTWIFGLCDVGMKRAEKNRMSQEKTGVAGRTNCEVRGMSMARA